MRQRSTKRRAPRHAAIDKRLSTARARSSSRIDSFLYSNRDRPAVTPSAVANPAAPGGTLRRQRMRTLVKKGGEPDAGSRDTATAGCAGAQARDQSASGQASIVVMAYQECGTHWPQRDSRCVGAASGTYVPRMHWGTRWGGGGALIDQRRARGRRTAAPHSGATRHGVHNQRR